jgi:LCP family protein required for cell wall assembly
MITLSFPRRSFAVTQTWWGDLLGLLVGAGVVALAVTRWNDHVGLLVSILLGGVAAVLTWVLIRRLRTRRAFDPAVLLGTGSLGAIPLFEPSRPAPVLTNPASEVAAAYREAAAGLESFARGKVFLIAAPQPGMGTTTMAINLALAATAAGRRVLLIDGDIERRGLSRYGGTDPSPGLTELVAGEADLQQAARMWRLPNGASIPVIPAGDPTAMGRRTGAEALQAALARIRNRADLVLVDSAPILWDTPSPLSEAADGVILVVDDHVPAKALQATREAFEHSPAPLTGFITNRTAHGESVTNPHPIRRIIARGVLITAVALAAYAGFTGWQLWSSWSSVEREALETVEAREFFSSTVPTTTPDEPAEVLEPEIVAVQTAARVVADDYFDAYLIVGSDARPELGGSRADVIIVILMPKSGANPSIVSIPRDLYLPSPCWNRNERINANFNGCDGFNGATMLTVAIEDYTGIEIDHFALFDFDGFEEIIDGIGGVEICVDYRVRDSKSGLDLPAGCTEAGGEQALAWVRSRATLELVNGEWRVMPGVSDLARNERQQEIILQVFSKVKDFDSPSELTRKVSALADAFTLSDSIGIGEAVDLAWDLRGLDLATVHRFTIPVRFYVNEREDQVLLPTASFQDLILEIYPDVEFS